MKVGVIMGGISDEREISLLSGEEIVKYLNKEKYEEVVPIIINSKKDVIEKVENIDFAFIALHGKFGEDGTIQGILEALDIPYSGCGVLTSAICMNKSISKKIVKGEGIMTAPWTTVKSILEIDYDKIKNIGYPVFIKPNSGGSSVATFLIRDEADILKGVEEVLKYDNEVIIEKYIDGIEITSFILNGEVFPTLSIRANNGEFFDYSSKYDKGGAVEELIKFEDELQKTINLWSQKIWNILQCKSYSRVDMIISDGVPYFLEVNTLPGMTKESLIPKSARAKGLDFSNLLDKIIEYSL